MLPAHTAAHVIITRGDTLSALAAAHHMPWPALYEYNRGRIGPDPDVIVPGMWLRIPAHPGKWLARYRTHPVVKHTVVHYSQPASGGSSAPVASTHVAPTGGSFEQCVIARESGGNSQVMNSTGHYGLFQFDIGTWESGGGSAADFGHASVSEQEQVFASVYAARGTSPWAPYDGC
jgi:LysM repeat protein